MTEAEWLACDEPQKLVVLLRDTMTERKLRLLAAACVRRHALLPALAEVAATVEEYADGRATGEALSAAHTACRAVETGDGVPGLGTAATYRDAAWAASKVVWEAAGSRARPEARRAGEHFERDEVGTPPWSQALHDGWDAGWRQELLDLWGYVRDLSAAHDRVFLVTPAVVSLARTIYDERAFGRMLELADALQTAGCDSPNILGHCRGPGPHVRGCWVLDLILGRE